MTDQAEREREGRCLACGGSGYSDDDWEPDDTTKCPRCGGTGKQFVELEAEPMPIRAEERGGLLAEADHAEKTGANNGMVLMTPAFTRRVCYDLAALAFYKAQERVRSRLKWRAGIPDEKDKP